MLSYVDYSNAYVKIQQVFLLIERKNDIGTLVEADERSDRHDHLFIAYNGAKMIKDEMGNKSLTSKQPAIDTANLVIAPPRKWKKCQKKLPPIINLLCP